MIFDFEGLDIDKLASDLFGIAKKTIDFAMDQRLKSENEDAMKSRNSRDITYQLGKTEERYSKAISIYDRVMDVEVRRRANITNQFKMTNVQEIPIQKYACCSNCNRTILILVLQSNYHWETPITPLTCLDCLRLDELTRNLRFLTLTQKALDKSIEKVEEKVIDWLIRHLSDSTGEIKRYYFTEKTGGIGYDI